MPLFLRPQTDIDDQHGIFFYVHDAPGPGEPGKVVGRVYRTEPLDSVRAESWFWGVSFFPTIGAIPHYGHAPTKELAMAAFKKRWLLSHPEG